MERQQPRLQLSQISKRFGATLALSDASLDLAPGEVHALLGENGSGKSTLVKTIGGVHSPDLGTISFDGQAVALANPRAAQGLGISVVFQEVLTASSESVLDNIWLGAGGMFKRPHRDDEARAIAARVLDELTDGVSLDAPAGALSLSERQAITIARALVRDPRLLVLDESTAALDVETRDRLFGVVQRLQKSGVATLFISHRMDEVLQIANRVTVLRSGSTVATHVAQDVSIPQLIDEMSGEAQEHVTSRSKRAAGETVLDAPTVKLTPTAQPFDFQLRAGELVGLAGLDGHGQDRFIKWLAERSKSRSGAIAPDAAVAYLPRERRGESLFEQMSIRENFGLPTFKRDRRGPFLQKTRSTERLQAFVDALGIRIGGSADPISSLSGGNQQKVLLARWLATKPDILLLNDPTRGVDIKTKRQIYKTLDGLCQSGVAVVCLSSEVDELVEMADRVLVFREQTLSSEIPLDQLSHQAIVSAYFGELENSR